VPRARRLAWLATAFDNPFAARDNARMARKQPYHIMYDEATKTHLLAIEPKHHSLIREKIEEQLKFDPLRATCNRKPLRQPAPFEATWEIRFGPDNRFRVLYGIDEERRQVQIQAIGVKEGNRLLISGEEVEL
jgi:mRNA-degrading endonuclease RelE of RelBE toxin-antitoxin system